MLSGAIVTSTRRIQAASTRTGSCEARSTLSGVSCVRKPTMSAWSRDSGTGTAVPESAVRTCFTPSSESR